MKVCRASSSMPLISPMVDIDGELYLDGGLADSIPIKRALEIGNQKVIVILTRNPDYRKRPTTKAVAKLYRQAYRSYPKLVRTAILRNKKYNQQAELVEKLEKEGKIFVVRPLIPTVSRLEKDYDMLMNFYDHGYCLMRREYNRLMEYLEG